MQGYVADVSVEEEDLEGEPSFQDALCGGAASFQREQNPLQELQGSSSWGTLPRVVTVWTLGTGWFYRI